MKRWSGTVRFLFLGAVFLYCISIYAVPPSITGVFGFTLGDRGKNGYTRCVKRFRNFKKCRLKVTDKTRQIYFIEAVCTAPSPEEAQKEYTIIVEALRRKYQRRSQTTSQVRPVRLRTDQIYKVTINQREIICRRANKQVILTCIDQALSRSVQALKSAQPNEDLTKEVSSVPLDAI